MPPAPRRLRSTVTLVACCAVAGVLAQLAGQDASWDLRNHTLYNPWAWLSDRYGFDLAPAQRQTFQNPLTNLPLHWMVAADWPPRRIAFVLALPAGVAAWLLWQIAGRLLAHDDARVARASVAAAWIIGLGGAIGVSLFATSIQPWYVAPFVLASLCLLLREPEAPALATVVFAGLVAGLAAGLAPGAGIYVAGLCAISLTTQPFRRGVAHAAAFAACALAGFALSGGVWMGVVQKHYGSPLFPDLNAWLRSPLLPPEFVAISTGEKPGFFDARLPLLAVLAVAVVVVALVPRWRSALRSDPGHPPWCRMATFVIASLVAWGASNASYRELLVLELVSGIAIAGAVLALPTRNPTFEARVRIAMLAIVTIVLVVTTRPPDIGRIRFGEHWLEVRRPPVDWNALIVLTSDAPMPHVLTRFPAHARHVGIDTNLLRAGESTGLSARVANVIDTHDGPIYQLTPQGTDAASALARFGLRRTSDACGEVRSNLTHVVLVLCPLERFARAGGLRATDRAPGR